jgi:hypothetical protein
MANDPPFATLNHFAADLGIPSESDLLGIGTKLRLVDQSNVRKALASAEREKMATGPRPWDVVSHSDSN